ncbi:MAG: UDP-N-acetylglucosamine enolpyruvyl transferase [Eubacterium sp.]|nr:UDP-N-acetylglucosamine enolpyruvyl transferase [Eubacterium sp.]
MCNYNHQECPSVTEVYYIMNKIIVSGGKKLKGEISIEGAKNSVLPILAATILNGGENIIKNCPMFSDVEVILDILKTIGCKVKVEDSVAIIDSTTISSTVVPESLASEMRSSIILMGPLLAREGKVTISYPGECVT